MEELVNVAVEEVAVEGSSGCSVSELWRLLEAKLPLPSGHVTALTDTVKQYIWVSLLQQRPLDILLYLPSGTSPHEPRPATKGKKKDSQQAQEELQETCPFESVPHYKDAEERGVRIKASTLARNNVLGLYDAHTSRFQLSGPQIMTLETIARARHLGALQSNLASKMNITNANFFYVVKCLEERGLIARTPVLLTTQRTARSNGVLTTNVLHLTRYAPPVRLGPSQVFKMVEVQGHHQQLDADTATYTIQDESRFMRLVSERIASTVGKAVIESELKIVLGFTGKKGHRYWRRIKGKLLKNGNIHVYVAEMNGKAVTCVKLLKEYTGPAEEGEGDGDEGEAEAINNGSLLVEVPLERQMLEAVLDAGHDGILTMHIFERLHLMAKKYVPALNELVKKYGLQVIPQHVGRVMQNRILAPPHLLEQYQHAQYTAFGVVPTQRASLPSQQQQGVPGEAEMHGGGEGAAEAPGTAGVGDAGPSSSMGGLQASVVGLGEAQASGPRAQTPLPQRASPAAAGAAGPSSVSEGVHAASASGAGERTTEGEGAGAGPATGQPAKRWAMRTTDLSDNRVRRLLARLEEQGFLVRHEIRAMLYNFEVANGLVPPSTSVYSKGPDKKTIERLIVRMEKANKAKRLSIAVPGSYQQGEARLTEVIVPFEPEVTDEKIKTMQDYFIMYERNLRQSSSNKYFLEKNQALRSITERQQQQTQRQQEGGKKIDHSDTQVAAEGGSPAPQLGQPSQQQHQQQQPSRPQAEQQGMVERVEAVARMGVGVHRMQDGKVVPLTGEERITRLLPPGSSLHGIRASLLAQGKTQRALQPAGSTFSFTPQRQLLPGVNASISGTRMAVQDQQALISGSSYQGERSTVRMTLNGYSWARQARVRLLHSFLCAFTGMCEPRQPPAPQQQQQQQLQQQHQQGQLQQQEDRTQGHAAAASVAEGEEVVTAARPPAVPAVPPPQDTQDQQSLFRPSTPKMSTEVFLSEGLEVGWQLRHLCAAAEPAQPLPEWKDMSGTQYGVTLELKQLEQRNRLVLTGDLQAAPIAAASGPRARTPPQEQQKQQRQQQQQQQQRLLTHSCTTRQLWDALPLSIALKVVGTSNPVPNLLELCEQGKRVGDFTEQQQVELFDPSCRRRFTGLLSILAKLKLLDFHLMDNSQGSSSTVLAVSTEGTIEAPATEAVRLLSSSDAAGGDARSGQHLHYTQQQLQQQGARVPQGAGPDSTPAACAPDAPDLSDPAAVAAAVTAAARLDKGPATKRQRTQPPTHAPPHAAHGEQPPNGVHANVGARAAEGTTSPGGSEAGAAHTALASVSDHQRLAAPQPRPHALAAATATEAAAASATAGTTAPQSNQSAAATQQQGLAEGGLGGDMRSLPGASVSPNGPGVLPGVPRGAQGWPQGWQEVGKLAEDGPVVLKRVFDLRSAQELVAYWRSLEQLFSSLHLKKVNSSALGKCFPGSDVSELFSSTSWVQAHNHLDVITWLRLVRRMDAERIKACAAPAAAAACNSSQQGMHAQQGHEQGFSAKNVLAVAQELNVENSLALKAANMLLRYHAPFGAGESVGGKNPLVVPSSSISAALHAAGLVSKRQKQKQPKPTSDPQPQSSKKSQKAKEAKEAREALQSERKRNREERNRSRHERRALRVAKHREKHEAAIVRIGTQLAFTQETTARTKAEFSRLQSQLDVARSLLVGEEPPPTAVVDPRRANVQPQPADVQQLMLQLNMKATEIQKLEQFALALQATLANHQAQAAQQQEALETLANKSLRGSTSQKAQRTRQAASRKRRSGSVSGAESEAGEGTEGGESETDAGGTDAENTDAEATDAESGALTDMGDEEEAEADAVLPQRKPKKAKKWADGRGLLRFALEDSRRMMHAWVVARVQQGFGLRNYIYTPGSLPFSRRVCNRHFSWLKKGYAPQMDVVRQAMADANAAYRDAMARGNGSQAQVLESLVRPILAPAGPVETLLAAVAEKRAKTGKQPNPDSRPEALKTPSSGNKPPGVSRPLPASLTDALAEGRPSSHEDTEAAAAPVRGPPSVALKRMLAHSGGTVRGRVTAFKTNKLTPGAVAAMELIRSLMVLHRSSPLGGLATSQLQALLCRFPSADLQAALHILRLGDWVCVQQSSSSADTHTGKADAIAGADAGADNAANTAHTTTTTTTTTAAEDGTGDAPAAAAAAAAAAVGDRKEEKGDSGSPALVWQLSPTFRACMVSVGIDGVSRATQQPYNPTSSSNDINNSSTTDITTVVRTASTQVSDATRAVYNFIAAQLMPGTMGKDFSSAGAGAAAATSPTRQDQQQQFRSAAQRELIHLGRSLVGDLWVQAQPGSLEAPGVDGEAGAERMGQGATLELTAPSAAVPSALVAALLPCMAQGELQLWPQAAEVADVAEAANTSPLAFPSNSNHQDAARRAAAAEAAAAMEGGGAICAMRVQLKPQQMWLQTMQQQQQQQQRQQDKESGPHQPLQQCQSLESEDVCITQRLADVLLADVDDVLELPHPRGWLIRQFAPHKVGSSTASRAMAERACASHAQHLAEAEGPLLIPAPPAPPAPGAGADPEASGQAAAGCNVTASDSTHPGSSSSSSRETVLAALQRLRIAGRQGLSLRCLAEATPTDAPHQQHHYQQQQERDQLQLQLQQQQQQFHHLPTQQEHPSPDAHTLRTASLVAACLLRHGLARHLPAYHGCRLLASEVSQLLVVRVLPTATNSMHITTTAGHSDSSPALASKTAAGAPVSQPSSSAAPPRQQQQQQQQGCENIEHMDMDHPAIVASIADGDAVDAAAQQASQSPLHASGKTGAGDAGHAAGAAGTATSAAAWGEELEVPLAPWLDAEGAVNQDFLLALVRRALVAVDSMPGAPEELLLAKAMDLVCPSNARILLQRMAACKLLGMSSVTPGSGSARSNRSPGAAEPAAAAAAAKTTSRVPRLLRKSAPSCAPISSPLASRYQAPHEGQRQQPQQQFSQQHGLEPHAEGPRDRAHGAACPKASTPVRHYLPIMGAATQCDISMHLRALAYGA